MAALATLEELEARMGPVDETKGQAALDDASILARAEAGTDWTGEGEEVPEVVVVIVLAAAARALRNPDQTESERIGQYQVVYQRQLNGVWLTRGECRLIRKAVGRSGIGSIELESPYAPAEVATVPVDIGGDPMPWATIGDEQDPYV